MSNIVKSERVGLVQIGSYKEALHFAETVAKSNFVPKAFQGRPGDVMVAMQWGAEIGLKPLQALQNIAVINGRPGMYGDAALALIQSSGLLDDIEETFDRDTKTATCRLVRKGRKSEISYSYSKADAETARLWGKTGPWQQYPQRMLEMRARGFALRNGFPDVLMGLGIGEELEDIPMEDQKHEMPAQLAKSISIKPREIAEQEAIEDAEIVELATAEQQAQIQSLCKEIGWDGKKLGEYLAKAKATWNTLTAEQADKVIVRLIEKRNAQPKKPAVSTDVRWEGFDQTIGSTAVEMGWAKEQIDKKAIELTGKAFSEYEGAADVSLYKTLSSAMVTEFNKFEDAKAVAHA